MHCLYSSQQPHWIGLVSPFHRYGDWGSETWSYLPSVTQTEVGGGSPGVQVCVIPPPCCLVSRISGPRVTWDSGQTAGWVRSCLWLPKSLPLFKERAIQEMGTMTVAAQTSWALGTRWSCPAINSPCTIDSLTRWSEVTPRGPWSLAPGRGEGAQTCDGFSCGPHREGRGPLTQMDNLRPTRN